MLEIIKNKFFVYKNVWFADETLYPANRGRKCDVCCLIGIPTLHNDSINSIKYSSLITDLTLSKEELDSRIGHHTLKELRRSEKDNFEIIQYLSKDILDNRNIVDGFVRMYMENYKLKGLAPYNPTQEIIRCARFGGIVITAVRYEGEVLAYHVCVVDEDNARSWMSTSSFRESDDNDYKRRVGRANKRLRYEDLLYFKRTGKKTYDFGGISSYDDPNGIDQLKMSFGGTYIEYYDETIICSFKYKLFYKIKKLLKRLLKK